MAAMQPDGSCHWNTASSKPGSRLSLRNKQLPLLCDVEIHHICYDIQGLQSVHISCDRVRLICDAKPNLQPDHMQVHTLHSAVFNIHEPVTA